jgi:tRNA threonylcarbamoyladenosine biosynthesis protein TsaB
LPSEPLVLAFDTSAAHCAAALLFGDTVLAQKSEPMVRGQAERLVPLLQDLLQQTDRGWSEISRIGVGIGPGNFTGIRISVALARGLSLGLSIPALGVSGFAAIRQIDPEAANPAIMAPRDCVYLDTPDLHQCALLDAPDHLRFPPLNLSEFAAAIARVARDSDDVTPPAPLYIRPADAAPARDRAPVLLE